MIKFTHKVDDDLINDQWLLDPKKFQPNMIVNGASEHYGYGMLELLAEQVPDSVVYSHDPNDHLKLPNLKFYPYWYHQMLEERPIHHYEKNMESDRRDYLIGCFNMSSHPHRIVNWLHIRKLENCIVTMFDDEKYNGNNVIELTPKEKQEWVDLKSRLLKRSHKNINGPQEANTDAYVNLVTETTICDKIFLTEKSWKPIAFGQLFILLSNPGSINHLRSIGIDCYDDIIDHSYDNELDPRQRIYRVWESIDKLLKEDLYLINKETRDRIQRNAELFWSGKLYEL